MYQQLNSSSLCIPFMSESTCFSVFLLDILFRAKQSPSTRSLSKPWTITGYRERRLGETQTAECVCLFWLISVNHEGVFQLLWAWHKCFTILSRFSPVHSPGKYLSKYLRRSLFFITLPGYIKTASKRYTGNKLNEPSTVPSSVRFTNTDNS